MLDISKHELLVDFPTAEAFHDYLCAVQVVSFLKSAMFSSTVDSCGVSVHISEFHEFLVIGSSSEYILSIVKKFFESKGYEFICDFKKGFVDINWR